jgi:orotate phosphoribosyltransferase
VSEAVLQVFRDAGAILDGHFRLTSGRHSAMYIEKFRVLQYPEHTGRLCGIMAGFARPFNVTLVAGPTTGGVILSYETARQLGARSAFAEHEGNGRAFLRDFVINPGERTLVVDDILTTGGSVRDTIAAVRNAGAEPVAVAVLIDRSGGKTDFGLPFYPCGELEIATYAAGDCPLCAAGVPLTVT